MVPSELFGALAIGRPVLFLGSPDSAIAKWIWEFRVGWVLDPERIEQLARELTEWSQCSKAKPRMLQLCHEASQREFSKTRAMDHWDHVLRALE